MGRIGAGAYVAMHQRHGETVVGVDIDPRTVREHRSAGSNVLLGDPSDADFWDRIQDTHTVELVMLALPNVTANLAVLDRLRAASFRGRVAATARFQDEIEPLARAGAPVVFDVYEETGSGFVAHVTARETTPRIRPGRHRLPSALQACVRDGRSNPRERSREDVSRRVAAAA